MKAAILLYLFPLYCNCGHHWAIRHACSCLTNINENKVKIQDSSYSSSYNHPQLTLKKIFLLFDSELSFRSTSNTKQPKTYICKLKLWKGLCILPLPLVVIPHNQENSLTSDQVLNNMGRTGIINSWYKWPFAWQHFAWQHSNYEIKINRLSSQDHDTSLSLCPLVCQLQIMGWRIELMACKKNWEKGVHWKPWSILVPSEP